MPACPSGRGLRGIGAQDLPENATFFVISLTRVPLHDMRKIYSAASLAEAYLLRDLLAQAGIESFIFNEHAAGAAGELPLTEVGPQIWIVEESDVPRARALLDRRERSHVTKEARPCARCGELSPGTFEICWSCGAPLAPAGL